MKVGSSQGCAIAVALLVALSLAGCNRSSESPTAKFLAAGKKLLQQGDASRAILQFQNATRTAPADPEVYYQLGVAYLGVGDIASGVGSLRKALELNPKHAAAQLRMAQLMASATDPKLLTDAQQRLQGLLRDNPEDADALKALALTELKLNESDDAFSHLVRALAFAPQDLIIAVTMAQLKIEQRDIKGAEEILKKACENSPKSPDALVTLGEFYRSQKRSAEAEQQFQRALTMNPNHAAALMDLAAMQRAAGRKEEAAQILKRIASLPDPALKAEYALFLFEEGRREEALVEFEKLAKQDPQDRVARTRLIAAYRSVNRRGDAEALIAAALKKNPKDLDALLQRGEMRFEVGRYAEAESDLNQVLHTEPNSAELHYTLAKFNQARGEANLYRQELFRAVELNPYLLSVRVELSQVLINSNDAKSALNLLNGAPSSLRKMMAFIVARNWALWAAGDLPEMRKGIDAGLAIKRSTELLLQDGMWKLQSNNSQGARGALEEALNLNPGDVRALAALNQTYAAQKQSATALEKIREYAARQPKSAPTQEFLGVLLMANGDRQHARAAFELAKAADPQFVTADLSLIQTDVADGKLDDAQRRLVGILSKNGSNTIARLWLGNVEASKGNRKGALEQFRQVVASDANNPQGLNNFAYLLAEDANQPEEALKYAQRARELAPDQAEYSDTLGWILYRKGLYSLAVTELERVASKEGNPRWKYHLAMAYAKAGDLNRARTTLQAAIKRDPNMPEAKIVEDMLKAQK